MYSLFFIFGIILASFLNALAYRISLGLKGKELYINSSHCERCMKPLRWYDLVPVISYIVSRGKCTQCGEKVFWYYPTSELLLGISFSLFYLYSAPIVAYILLLLLFYLSYWDIKTKCIPKITTDILFVLSSLYLIFRTYTNGTEMIMVEIGLVVFLFMSVWIVNRKVEKIGLGDILILSSVLFVMGGIVGVATILYSVLIAGIYATILVYKDARNRKKYIPLLPFITVGYVLAVLYPNILTFLGL